MGTVAEEVLQHLTALPGAEVEVSVEISSKIPAGVSRTIRRIVEENCRILRCPLSSIRGRVGALSVKSSTRQR